jgi:glycosyltransferase involved in cell wall biosynthesis
VKILYISYDGMTDPLGQSQVLPYLVGLSSAGYQITLLSCEKKERYKLLQKKIEAITISANIDWHPTDYSESKSVLGKLMNLKNIKKVTHEILFRKNFDVVHCRSYMAALIGLELKKKNGLSLLFDMRGFWADERTDGNIWNKKKQLQNLQYKYFKRMERIFLQKADGVVSLTESAKQEMLKWNIKSLTNDKIIVIPCCADLSLFSINNINPNEQSTLKKNLHINEEDFVLSYLGSIGTWYMLDEMLDFFKALLIKKPHSKFLFITQDNSAEIIKRAQEKNISSEKIIITAAQRNQIPALIKLSDLSIYFIKQAYSKKASSPTKTAEIMALKVPIITNSGIGDSDKIISESKGGILIESFNEKNYQLALEKLDKFLEQYPQNFDANYIQYFSLERGIELYDKIYKTIGQKKHE